MLDSIGLTADADKRVGKYSGGMRKKLEVAVKTEKIVNILRDFSANKRLLETETGYRIYSRDGDKMLAEIARSLDHAGYKVTRLEMTRPSLEDVFFKLTEKAVREVS
jgi:ABC-type multidrug transport system ATPase subunit